MLTGSANALPHKRVRTMIPSLVALSYRGNYPQALIAWKHRVVFGILDLRNTFFCPSGGVAKRGPAADNEFRSSADNPNQSKACMLASEDLLTAYHEAGHAVIAMVVGKAVHRVSIVPNATRLGACELKKGRLCASNDELEDEVLVLLAGVAAEGRLTGQYNWSGVQGICDWHCKRSIRGHRPKSRPNDFASGYSIRSNIYWTMTPTGPPWKSSQKN